jgi:hypothetical protein
MFKVYFGPPVARHSRSINMSNRSSIDFADLPDALLWAYEAAKLGTVTHRVEGGGKALDRGEIAACLSALALGDSAVASYEE